MYKKIILWCLSIVSCAVYASTPTPTHAEQILDRVQEAKIFCASQPLSVGTTPDASVPGGVRISTRPIVLCAYSEQSHSWHAVELALEYPVSRTYISCVANAPTLALRQSCVLNFAVKTPGYRVEHLGGYGVTRFCATVYHGDEKLVVYRIRHLWFDDDALASGDVDRIKRTAMGISYTPYHPDFHDPTLVELGMQFLKERIDNAYADMNNRVGGAVQSNAFPNRRLTDVVPWQIPMSLAVIEQMDDKTFFESNDHTVESIFVEYALNRDDAFRWAQSGANAIGPLQFTNANGDGTYNAMVRGCPRADLDPDFVTGARNLPNVIKAAVCLIDTEVAQFPVIQGLYARNPLIGGIYPIAAYNGSPASARALYKWIRKKRINIEHQEIQLPDTLRGSRIEHCPCANVSKKNRHRRTITHITQNTETPGYVTKYLYLLDYLSDKGLE